MTAFSCRIGILLIMGALSLTAGCATVTDQTEIRPRMTWGSVEEVEETPVEAEPEPEEEEEEEEKETEE